MEKEKVSTLEHSKYKVAFWLKYVVLGFVVLFLVFCSRSRTVYDVAEIDRGEITYISVHIMESGFNKWAEPEAWFYNLSTDGENENIIKDLIGALDEARLRVVWLEGMYRDSLMLSSVDEQHTVSTVICVGEGEEYTYLTISDSGIVHVTANAGTKTKGYYVTDSHMLDELIAYVKECGQMSQ